MTKDEVIAKLKAEAGRNAPKGARRKVADETGLKYHYLCHLVYDEIPNPGSAQIDKLRSYFEARQ